ncbi:vesicle-associated membrane protein 7 [Strigomonas culicis]|nr:vesicle-associated membrane protein 7 [Strigomonas culicis]|eukprot:EPY32244.1 vesicle-associated membrane protein 7 [Strigomonas culicis]
MKFGGGADRYPRPSDLNPSNCNNFSVILGATAKTFNEDPQADKFGKIKEELTNTRQVMLENLDTVVVRGDNINNLCDRTELLREEAQGFHSNSRSLKRTLMWHHIKIVIGVILALAAIGLIIAFMVCGINFKKC